LYFVPEFEVRAGVIRSITLDPRFEQFLGTKVHRSPTEVGLALDPSTGRHLFEEISCRSAEFSQQGQTAILTVSSEVRLPLRRFLEASFPRLAVLAFQEIPSGVEIENAGIVLLPQRHDVVLNKAA
jgi:flagellar biosynthesis protein FlhA